MNIGVLPSLRGEGGGAYQYCLCCLQGLRRWQVDGAPHQFTVFSRHATHPLLKTLRRNGWRIQPPEQPAPLERLRAIVGEGVHRDLWRWIRRGGRQAVVPPINANEGLERPAPATDDIQDRPTQRRWFQRCGVDLMVYPTTDITSFEIGLPYVAAVHDLQHRLQPEFPEVSAEGRWAWREYAFRNICRFATLILVDSEVGKEDVLNFYGTDGIAPDRIKVLPYLPASYLPQEVSPTQITQACAALGLPDRYFFYPAQFWPHKNHVRIVQAMALLKQRGVAVHMVFSGSTVGGEFREQIHQTVQEEATRAGITGQIRILGYVEEQHMAALYAGAVALVMPTFFGPTNIPPLEAWALGCPVLTSDIRGIREQMGNAAVLADPRSVEAIAGGMERLWTDATFCQSLREAGRQRLAGYTPQHYQTRLNAIMEEAVTRVQQGVVPAPPQSRKSQHGTD